MLRRFPIDPPEFLKLTRRERLVWQGPARRAHAKTVDFLAGKPVEDLSVGRPDLESLFRRFYEHAREDDDESRAAYPRFS